MPCSRASLRSVLASILLPGLAKAQGPATKAIPVKPTAEVREGLRRTTPRLADLLSRNEREGKARGNAALTTDVHADVEIYLAAALRMDAFDEYADAGDPAMVEALLSTGLARAEELAKGKAPWTTGRGSVARGFRSKMDGSVQPYVVEIPEAL
jgi:hypothetical protein